jgi:hypothetical protein
MNISFRKGQQKLIKDSASVSSQSEDEELEIPDRPVAEKSETFAEKLPKLKESREKLRKFIELKDPN